jgi:hypothetical protein
LITVTLINSGFVSTERIGLVLLLWPGVELVLLAIKCELSRWGNGNRTMAEEEQVAGRSSESRGRSNAVKGKRKREQEMRPRKWTRRIRVSVVA